MEDLAEKIIEFTRKLVQTPSQNGIDSEKGVADLVFAKLSSFGFSPKILIDGKFHPSVFCPIRKNPSGKTVWLETCLDTVPAGDLSRWDYAPFRATVVGKKMYGRGTADSKVGIAIFSFLAKELYENPEFNGNLILGFNANEQSGEFTGIKEIIKQKPKADICILGYQGISEISIGARGFLRLKLTTKGEAAHTGSRRKKGNNAIHQMTDLIIALRGLNLDDKKEPYFPYGGNFNVSLISGGTMINMVPDSCEAKIDIRFLPSQTKEKILKKINKTIRRLSKEDPKINCSLEILQSESAFLTDPKNDFVRLLQKTAEKELKKETPLVTSGQGSVGNIIGKLGVPIINAFGCNSDNGHAPNEWINIETILPVFRIYKKAILQYCQ
ncbi:MAG: M20 family metallopeptidase [bacterium]|nr:M20 family metallopeptidase [bacterium]